MEGHQSEVLFSLSINTHLFIGPRSPLSAPDTHPSFPPSQIPSLSGFKRLRRVEFSYNEVWIAV